MDNINTILPVVRWGILGCGDVTEKKSVPAYQKTEGFEVVAVMRRDAEKVADYARRHGVEKYYTDADALINDPEIDAIYIATPPDVHKYYALKVAEAGKICCIEKPLAPSYEDCKIIQEAFDTKDIPLFVAYYRRSLPRFEQIKKWLEERSIGEVRHINWHLSKPTSERDSSSAYNWRTDIRVAPAGYFDDLASHGLDLFVHFLGHVKQANGISSNQQGLYTAKDAIVGCWIHENGVTGTGSWNFGTSTREDLVTIYGSLGTITFSVFEETNIILRIGDTVTELFIPHPENVQFYHVQNIRDHLAGKVTHPSNGLTASHTAWVMDKIIGIK
ncbi:MAG: 1,5-anhydro-D-fructose reductase (1,5-anhydro-D-mannitol-forming) [Flavobacteriales bacterium]|jgi:1,5-anhydro-D-fructose reductase (1,5-anhydro-D-mannitol-forming)